MKKFSIAFILAIILLAVSVGYAVITTSWTIHVSWKIIERKTGSLVIYDSDGKTILHSINFGEVERGKTYVKQIIIKNNGTVALKLHLRVPNQACGQGAYGQISWDKEGYILKPGESITATIKLFIPSTAPVGETCEIDIGIEGTEVKD